MALHTQSNLKLPRGLGAFRSNAVEEKTQLNHSRKPEVLEKFESLSLVVGSQIGAVNRRWRSVRRSKA